MFRTKLLYSVLIVLLVVCSSLFGATTGKISGTVVDAESGDPLPGVNVVVQNTTLGSATDLEGRYFIINVPVGTYNIQASMVGYARTTVSDVRVKIDQTTVVDFKMKQEVIEGQEVTIVAERPIVELDLTASKEVASAREIATSWVAEPQDVVQAQQGVNIHGGIRGGFGLDVSYRLDGVDLRDAGSNTSYKGINLSSVEEMEVFTGGFNAEYGQARGAIINIVTKEARESWHGILKYRARPAGKYHWGPNIYSENNWDRTVMATEEFWTENDGGKEPFISMTPAERAAWWREFAKGDQAQSRYAERMQWELEGTAYGPVTNKLGLLLSLRWKEGVEKFPTVLPYSPEWNGQAKLTYQLATNTKLIATGLYGGYRNGGRPRTFYNSSEDGWPTESAAVSELRDPYDNDKYWMWGGNDTGLRPPEYVDYYNSSLKLTHVFSPATYLDVMMTFSDFKMESNFYDVAKTAYFPETNRPRPGDEDYPVIPDTPLGYRVGSTSDRYWNDAHTKNAILRADFVSQLNVYNQLKAGFDFNYGYYSRRHTDYASFSSSTQTIRRIETNYYPGYKHDFNPLEGSAYIQDKIEVEGMVINAGLRLDAFNANQIISTYFPDQLRIHPDTPGNIAPGVISTNFEKVEDGLSRKSPWNVRLSPRLGISHPISETTVLHFMYGHFYQRPPWHKIGAFPLIRINGEWTDLERDHSNLEPGLPVVHTHWGHGGGNPAITYERSVQYEVGFDQNIADKLRLKVTMYYKDQKDLTAAGLSQGGGQYDTDYGGGYAGFYMRYNGVPGEYSQRTAGKNLGPRVVPVNGGYADARGLEASLDSRLSNLLSFRLMYNLSFVSTGRYYWFKLGTPDEKGNYYKAPEWYGANNTDGGRSERSNEYWNPNNSAKLLVNFSLPNDFGPALGSFRPLSQWYLNLYTEWAQGRRFTYYTPDEIASAGNRILKPLNKRWKDRWYTRIKLSRELNLLRNLKAILSLEVRNLFNNKVLRLPGGNDMDLWFLEGKHPTQSVTGEETEWNWYQWNTMPREMFFGLAFEF